MHRLLLISLLLLLLGGCAGEEPSGPAAPPPEPSAEYGPGLPGRDVLLAELQQRARDGDWEGVLDLVRPRHGLEAERMLVQQLRLIGVARERLDEAHRAAFPGTEPAGGRALAHLGSLPMPTEFVEDGRRSTATYIDADGQPRALVLVRYRESWWLDTRTLSGGEDITDNWFALRRPYLLGAARRINEVAGDLTSGLYASPHDVEADLQWRRVPWLLVAGVD